MKKVLKNKYFILLLFLANIYVWHLVFNFYWLKPSVRFLNVYEGDSALVINKSGNILVDAGRRNYVLNPLVNSLPFFERTIDVAMITHADSDHFEGLKYILDDYVVRVVVINDFWNNKKNYQSLLKKLVDKKITVVLGVSGVEINTDGFWGKIVYPELKDIFDNKTNEKSQVMLVDFLNKKMLFTGDITDKIFKNIVNSNNIDNIDILKSPHHGGKKTISADILSQLSVDEAIISVGDNNYGHPSFETLKIYDDFNVKVRRTDIEGSIIVE